GGLVTLHDQFRVLFDRGPDRISPFFINMMIIDGAPGIVSILTGAKGPNWAAVSACATSSNTIGEAWEMIRRGEAKAMIAGGPKNLLRPFALPLLTICMLSRAITRTLRQPVAPSMRHAMALSWAKGRVCSSWKIWSSPGHVV